MDSKRNKIKIGIDPGTKTGIAIANKDGKLTEIRTVGIINAMRICLNCHNEHPVVYFEDARLRKWFGKSGRERLQGAGSIKRDCAIWQEFLEYYGFEYIKVSPLNKGQKLNSNMFKAITGWTKRTSEHGRDAALLII